MPRSAVALSRLTRLSAAIALGCALASPATAQQAPGPAPIAPAHRPLDDFLTAGPDVWTSPEGLSSSLQILLLLTVLSLAPSVLLITTSFIRIVVVLGLLRQALGTQQLPPSQVITAIALFMTAAIMTPVWTEVYDEAIAPYTDPTVSMSLQEAWTRGAAPVRPR